MGRATGGVSDGKREASTIGPEALTIPLKYRSSYRKLRIGGMEHEEAKESAMSTKRAEPEEHVKQLKENPFGKSEPTWGAPKESPKAIAEVPRHPDNISKYLEKLENHPHIKDWESKPKGMVHHMRQQGVDAEHVKTETTKGGVINHEDGTAELTPSHVAHTIRVRGKEFTTPSPEHRKHTGHPRWLHVNSMELSPKGAEAMGRHLDQQTAQGLTLAAQKKKKTK